MMKIRLGTRGSELALTQARWFCDRLRKAHPGLEIEEIIIKTHGDTAQDAAFDSDWPVGSFVNAIERALLEERVDFAVHSFKDLQTEETAGLTIAAVPGREDAHDILLSKEAIEDIHNLKAGFRVGTSSPRRRAQMRRLRQDVEIVPIRGNVPTRIEKIKREGLDGVILAAAGVKRLGITHPHVTELPVDIFVPSAAQGALAIQTRIGTEAERLIAVLDVEEAHQAVRAERAFLAGIGAGCHTPAGAYGEITDGMIHLHGQLFSDDESVMVECRKEGRDAMELGGECERELLHQINQ